MAAQARPGHELTRAEIHAALTFTGRMTDREADAVIAHALALGLVEEHPDTPGALRAPRATNPSRAA